MKKILSLILTNFLVFTSNLSFADDINICIPEKFHICAYTGCKTTKIKQSEPGAFERNERNMGPTRVRIGTHMAC